MKIEELEAYRDENGYIDMDMVLSIKDFKILRETRGSQNREKFWITFDDGKIMLRTSNLDAENVEYTNYAELIVEELANQVGIPCAHYDLIKYKGHKGVYTKDVLERKNESLILAKTLLDQTDTEDEYDLTTMSIADLFKSHNIFRKYDDIPKEQIAQMNLNTALRTIFQIYAMSTDAHYENTGYIFYSDGTEKSVVLSPLFDNECSLMLDQPMERIDDMLKDRRLLEKYVELQNQVTVVPENQRDREYLDWQDMLFYLCDDSDTCMEFAEKCSSNLDIGSAMEKVEERIHAKLPDKLREYVTSCFKTRKKMIEKDLCINIDIDEVELW